MSDRIPIKFGPRSAREEWLEQTLRAARAFIAASAVYVTDAEIIAQQKAMLEVIDAGLSGEYNERTKNRP